MYIMFILVCIYNLFGMYFNICTLHWGPNLSLGPPEGSIEEMMGKALNK